MKCLYLGNINTQARSPLLILLFESQYEVKEDEYTFLDTPLI